MVIARKQVLVQLDDELVARLDAAASVAGISRSELIRRGAQAALEAIENVEKDRRLQAAYRRHPEGGDSFVQAAARLAFEELGEW
jgi:metal-responsive CopG/Arc/MetJ family transcriptional regulator